MDDKGYIDEATAIKSTQQSENQSSGYEPPSNGYQPPTYESPAEGAVNGEQRPTENAIVDEDEDDGPKPVEKSRAEIDRENDEMFRRVAEEDGKIVPALSNH